MLHATAQRRATLESRAERRVRLEAAVDRPRGRRWKRGARWRAVEIAHHLGARPGRDRGLRGSGAAGLPGRAHAAVRGARPAPAAGSSAAPATTTSCPRSSGWRSATPGTAEAGSAATSTPPASCCCMTHAFETLGAQLVGWRTDNYNFASQRAIERLGRAQGRRAAPPCAAPRRHRARHRDVQPGGRRMARGEGASAIPAGPAALHSIGRRADGVRTGLLHAGEKPNAR